jgi:hypothetical protein
MGATDGGLLNLAHHFDVHSAPNFYGFCDTPFGAAAIVRLAVVPVVVQLHKCVLVTHCLDTIEPQLQVD